MLFSYTIKYAHKTVTISSLLIALGLSACAPSEKSALPSSPTSQVESVIVPPETSNAANKESAATENSGNIQEIRQADKNVAASTGNAIADRAAPAKRANNDVAADERMGTRWGDEVSSEITMVDLKRASSTPIAQIQVRYADKAYNGRHLNDIALGAGQVSFSVIDDQGQPLPLYRTGSGGEVGYYVSARDGQAYQLHYQNNTRQTYEIVASVDGLDVINGSAASRRNHGYVLSPNDSLTIEGFRKSQSAVASFIFSKPQDAYAAHNTSGSVANTGIIGTVVYPLRVPNAAPVKRMRYAPAPTPEAFPADK